MAQYKTGTVNLTNANSTVIGINTLWEAGGNVSAGDIFISLSNPTVPYFVANVVSNTQITLSAPWAAANASGEAYTIARDFTANGLPMIYPGDLATSTLWNRLVSILDALV